MGSWGRRFVLIAIVGALVSMTVTLSPAASHVARPNAQITLPTITPLPTVSLTGLPTESPLPSLSASALPSVSVSPLPSVSISPLPSVSLSPLPSVSPSISPPPVELPSVEKLLRMARIKEIPEGIGLLLYFHFPENKPFEIIGLGDLVAFTVDILPDGGGVMMQNATASDSATGANAEPECGDRAYSATGPKWRSADIPIKWRMNKGSIPGYLNADKTTSKVQTAYDAWQRPVTKCNNVANNSFRFSFEGATAKGPKYDSVNSVDFGGLGSSSLAITYVWYAEGRIYESDLRMNKADYTWSNDPDANRKYQVVEVASHEGGHTVGLNDLKDPHGKLTMFGLIGKGELNKKTLGRGDFRGANLVAP